MEAFVVSIYNDETGIAEPAKMFPTKEKAIEYVVSREGGDLDPEEIDELIVELDDRGMVTTYQRSLENSYLITRMVMEND